MVWEWFLPELTLIGIVHWQAHMDFHPSSTIPRADRSRRAHLYLWLCSCHGLAQRSVGTTFAPESMRLTRRTLLYTYQSWT